jgi:hypothetical protein
VLLLWLAGRVGPQCIVCEPPRAMFPSFMAALDIALVFTTITGDVRLDLAQFTYACYLAASSASR